MKRNRLFTLTLATCAALLSACSTELDTSGNPERAGANEAIVAVSMQFPSADKPAGYAAKPAVPGAYADNDVPEGVALDAEKEIRSIAFIAFTTGGTGVYLSTEPTFAETGFTQPLAPAEGKPIGNYTASFKIRSDNFTGKTTLVAVANFHEHGLTFDPGALTIESLKAMLTVALEADKSIEYPLLMTIAQEFDIVEGATVPVDFKMERIMARVDVLNSAYDKQTPANGFVLTSARLLSAAAQGTMIGGQEITAPTYVDLEVQDEVKEVEPAEGDDFTPIKQQLAPMYVYENTNSEKDDATKLSATATAVEVKGTYKGKEYSKVISFVTPKKVVNGALEGGDIVPLARNTRYVIEIIAANETDVTFDLQVTDWAEGKRLDVELDFAAPVLEGLEGFTPGAGAVWDAASKTLDITNATAASTFELVARGNQDSDFSVESSYDENAPKVIDGITVMQGEIEGYADAEVGSLSRTYKFAVPQAIGEYPSMTKVILFNTSYADAQTVITVKYAPFFVGDWQNSQPAATIDPATGFINLKNVPDGNTGTISFFASSGSEITVSELTNKGVTPDFYTMNTQEVTEADLTNYPKYGPGKRVTLSYKAISEKTEFAEVSVAEAGGEATTKKIYMKCLKAPYVVSMEVKPDATNTLAGEAPDTYYLAINGNEHGHNKYTVYAEQGQDIAYNPTATYATTLTNPSWVKDIMIPFDNVTETYADYQIVKRSITLVWPYAIKNPAAATNFTIGLAGETPLHFIPVYPSGTGIAEVDKAFRPVLVKGIWWAPINIGQTKLSELGDPSSVSGNLFQWGRKTPLTFNSPIHAGTVPPDSPVINEDKFIRANPDWLTIRNDQLWNEGDETAPTRTSSDPCPTGWRVPTLGEGQSLLGNHTWEGAPTPSLDSNCRITINGESGAKLYFPAMGNRNMNGSSEFHGTYGHYWFSTTDEGQTGAPALLFSNSSFRGPSYKPRTNANPVRCVQE